MRQLKPFVFIGLLAGTLCLSAQTPEWIWHQKSSEAETRFFRKEFMVDGSITKAELTATGDDSLEVFLNGESVLKNGEWQNPSKTDVTARLKPGKNILQIRAYNADSSPAGLLAQLVITSGKEKKTIVSDSSWKASAREEQGWTTAAFNDGAWEKAKTLGKVGDAPWNDVAWNGKGSSKNETRRQATPAEALYTLPGFKVELVHSALPEEGSWVAMTRDNQGRLIISPQHGKGGGEGGLLRVTLGSDGTVAKREFIGKPVYDVQGITYVSNTIYAVVNKYSTKLASGLYRIRDTKGNDQFEDVQLLKEIPGSGEHGPHGVEMGPDGMLYVMAGNHTKLIDGMAPNSPHKNYAEDFLLPRQWDANGHAAGILAPGGYIARTDVDGKKWELMNGGYRNAYDFSFNADGELFTYDSDMEWEWGTHWYRPTRVYHTVSGGDYGWRSGSGKWPDYYMDGLPPAYEPGVGCPTGTAFGYGAKFPGRYQRAYYILDWTFGRIMAVHLTPQGASYSSVAENFICPKGLMGEGEKKPLNVTDLVVGRDGALYFTTGGRGVQAGLYRVSYVGNEKTAPVTLENQEGLAARQVRHQLETFHGRQDARALNVAWPQLRSEDRWIRYAARIAIESQPVEQWRQRTLEETDLNAGLTALFALARVGGKSAQVPSLEALGRLSSANKLNEEKRLEVLRILEVSFARNGKPDSETAEAVVEKLNPLYPSASYRMNKELVQLLVYLEAPGVVEKTFTLLDSAPTQEQQFAYLFHLRTLPARGWTLEQRQHYFTVLNSYPNDSAVHEKQTIKWFTDAGRPFADGNSFRKQLDKIREEAMATLSATEKTELADLIKVRSANAVSAARSSFPKPSTRSQVKEWTMNEIVPLLDQVKKGRSFQKGRQAFVDAQCLLCHKMGNEGGGVGPDLTAVAARFAPRDLLESILDPSKVVSEQFVNTTVEMKNGEDYTGRVMDETAEKLVLQPNPLQPGKVELKKSEIKSRSLAKLSPMPEGLANILSKEDILDLIAFLQAGGNNRNAVYQKK